MVTNAAAIAKHEYWLDKAVLEDPDAYMWLGWTSHGVNQQFDVTVPADETWWLIQAWQLKAQDAAGSALNLWFHRVGGIDRPFMLPGGTRLHTESTITSGGFAYICRPRMVQHLDKYKDPEALCYTRHKRLKSIALSELSVHVAPGASPTNAYAAFPGGVDKALIQQVSCHDAAWIGMFGNDAAAMNLYNEISDAHSQRYGAADKYPVRVETFDIGLCIQNGTASGTGVGYEQGYGHIWYQALPADW